jgi:major membrane immunogen (membrane-anchored lipoprotein)
MGLYSIAEVVESVMKNTHKKVIFNVIADDTDLHFNAQQIRSLINIGKMIMTYGAIFVSGLKPALLAIETIKEEKTEMTIKKNDFLPKYEKTLENSDSSGAHVNVSDLVTIGNGDLFQLVAKAYSEKEGWMKSTKAMNTPVGCMIQVTTQQKNSDGSYAIAEALSFISGIHISGEIDNRIFIKI